MTRRTRRWSPHSSSCTLSSEATTFWCASLDSVQDDEWQKSARVFNREMTIEKTFRDHVEHFKEHEADIKKGLGRS